MNDSQQEKNMNGILAPLIGFALGALVGGAIALLMAPESGEKTRRRIATAARQLGQDARDNYDKTREAAGELGLDVKAAITAGREAFRHDGKPNESRTASRVDQTLDPPVTRTL